MPKYEIILSGGAGPLFVEAEERPDFEGEGWTEVGNLYIRNASVLAIRQVRPRGSPPNRGAGETSDR